MAARPNPDLLLRRVQAEESPRARLRVFFGFAPGVGKTFRMLQVAREMKAHGTDLVVGIVETHARSETEALLEGLEHTNAPGSRHDKRWQDVLELLDAGIDVLTTVNVQHVESLNDVVAQITRVQVRETIPDSILERADEMELVDIAPDDLLERLEAGKVYLPDQAARAAQHFFQRGNLLALRELALRRTAQRVDQDVLLYRETHGVEATWPTAERLLVCVGPAPSAGQLIRSAYRIAASVRCPWSAVYVERTTGRALSKGARENLEANLALAESLGATVTRLTGTRVADALLAHARRANATRIVIGKPTHSRLRDRLFGSLLDDVVRGSGDIEVHAIRGAIEQAAERPGAAPPEKPTPWTAYAASAAIVALATLACLAVRHVYPVPDLEVLYLLAVMLAAVRYGRGPSIAAAFLAVVSYDFFFVPPSLTLEVADARYLLTFALMFGVGFLLSELTARIRRQEQDALLREERTAVLYALSRALASATDARQAAEIVARQAWDVFGAAAFVLRSNDEGPLTVVARWPESAFLDAKEVSVAQWANDNGRAAGFGTATLPGSKSVCFPIRIGSAALGVLALVPSGVAVAVEQHEFLDAFTRQAGFAFERARLIDDARVVAVRAKAEEMRSSLLSAVSHDLRTPLAAITGAATSLGSGVSEEARTELLETLVEEAERLERLVANLLEMTRLDSGEVRLKRAWVPLEEMVGSALARLEKRIGDRQVQVALGGAPLVSVDPVLFEQVFVNLLENALKYTPAESAIEIRATAREAQVEIEVGDRGAGLAPGTERRIFEKFFRGAHPGVGGVGLGLPICKAIVEAHGGTIAAENRPGGGTVFRVILPVPSEAPSISALLAEGAST
jgi:two-component system sensor histidine kinase KdpD